MTAMRAALLCALISVAAAAAASVRPWMADPQADPETRAQQLLDHMTLQDKIDLTHGWASNYTGNTPYNARLEIPALNLNDGPQGFRSNDYPGTTTSWPSGLTVAATFDVDAMAAWGKAMGKEFADKGANVQLGPGMCLARVPVNGRNFEYAAGEDPFLGYTLVQPLIKNIQSNGVIANAKHYVNNNQETNRHGVSANVGERVRFEMYYPPFAGAVAADVGSFMCSYNLINDRWSCENADTLGDLKNIIGKGKRFWVMSDWGATHSTSIKEGLDQEMPRGDYMNATLMAMVQNGTVSMGTLNNTIMNILTPMFAVGLFDNKPHGAVDANVTSDAHNAVARNLSAQSHVLLKNDGILPLSASKLKNVVVVGQQADTNVIVHGGGSGRVDAPYYISPLRGVRAALGFPLPTPGKTISCDNVQFLNDVDFNVPNNLHSESAGDSSECCKQCQEYQGCNDFTFYQGTCYLKSSEAGKEANPGRVSGSIRTPAPPSPDCHNGVCVRYLEDSSAANFSQILAEADVALVFVATTSSEGSDRANLSLANGQEALITETASHQPNTVVVMSVPGAILTDWRNDVRAIVTNFMPGQELGNAAADILFGKVNPSGRLPLTFPNVENEVGFTPREYPGINTTEAYYDEGLLVGYRWYDAHNVTPAFAFGHGLSYTTFEYSNIQASSSKVSVTLKNTGSMDGAEVPQLYLQMPASAGEPPKQLKGFTKVFLKAGASTTVTFPLVSRDLSIWDEKSHSWAEQKGSFTAFVGSSSRDIRQHATFNN